MQVANLSRASAHHSVLRFPSRFLIYFPEQKSLQSHQHFLCFQSRGRGLGVLEGGPHPVSHSPSASSSAGG